MSEVIIPVIVGIVSGVIGTVLSSKMLVYDAKKVITSIVNEQKDSLKTEIEQWLNSEKGQKALYAVGGLVGAGAKAQLGLGSGKMKLQDLIPQVLGGFFGNRNQTQTPVNQPSQGIPNA